MTEHNVQYVERKTTWICIIRGHYLFGAMVNAEHKQEGDEVEHSEHILTQTNILSMISKIIQPSEYIHKTSWIPETHIQNIESVLGSN